MGATTTATAATITIGTPDVTAQNGDHMPADFRNVAQGQTFVVPIGFPKLESFVMNVLRHPDSHAVDPYLTFELYEWTGSAPGALITTQILSADARFSVMTV